MSVASRGRFQKHLASAPVLINDDGFEEIGADSRRKTMAATASS
jgi:hypothetical protein